MADAFITAQELEDYLGYTLDSTRATVAVDSACEVLRAEAEQTFNLVADETVYLDSDGTDFLILPEAPVTEVASVTIRGSGTVLVENTHYIVDLPAAMIYTKSEAQTFLKGRQAYEVVYSHGYDTGEFPKSLTLLALHLAARIYDQGIVSSESVGGVSMSYAAPESIVLTDRERSLLTKAVGVGRTK